MALDNSKTKHTIRIDWTGLLLMNKADKMCFLEINGKKFKRNLFFPFCKFIKEINNFGLFYKLLLLKLSTLRG